MAVSPTASPDLKKNSTVEVLHTGKPIPVKEDLRQEGILRSWVSPRKVSLNKNPSSPRISISSDYSSPRETTPRETSSSISVSVDDLFSKECSPRERRKTLIPSLLKKKVEHRKRSSSVSSEGIVLSSSLSSSGSSPRSDFSPKKMLDPKYGLTKLQQEAIDSFAQSYWRKWSRELYTEGEHLHIKHTSFGLPRSFDIFIEGLQMHTMLRLKRKGVMENLGKGDYKTVTVAIDWLNRQSEYADIVIKGEDNIQNFETEYDITNRMAGKEGIIEPFIGKHTYQNRHDQKVLTVYSPKYDENLATFISKGAPSDSDLLKFIKDLCCGLRSLMEVDVEHNDLKETNIYIKNFEKAVIADFGCARAGYFMSGLKGKEAKSVMDKYYCVLGSNLYLPPDKRALHDIFVGLRTRPGGVEKYDEVYEILYEAQKYYDTWAMGVIFLGLLSGEIVNDVPGEPADTFLNKHAVCFTEERERMLSVSEKNSPMLKSYDPECQPSEIMKDFYKQFQEVVDREVDSVEKNIDQWSIKYPLLQIVKRMLIMDPSLRIKPSQVVNEVENLSRYYFSPSPF